MSDKKYYTVVKPKCDSVMYSSTPSGAAAKVYTHCIRTNSKKTQRKSHIIKIQRRSHNKGKIMTYRVKEKKQSTEIMRDGEPIKYRYKVKVKSLNK